jgi:hypothetical protein
MSIFDNLDYLLFKNNGVQIIVHKQKPKRTHRKRRINKKWIKRYGYHPCAIEDNQIIICNQGTKAIMMNMVTYQKMKKLIPVIIRSDLL